MTYVVLALLFLIAYLCGSVCSAILVCRFFDLPNPCSEGSKNPGATNVLRIAGKKYAAMVLVVDMLKGFLPVFIAGWFGVSLETLSYMGFAAVLGHMYPVFFRFEGGKGVATSLGVMFGFHLFLGLLVLGTWLLVAYRWRFSSLASIVSLALAPIYVLVMTQRFDVLPAFFLMTIFVLYQHRANLTRLMDGTEDKLSFGKKKEGKVKSVRRPRNHK